ncbi:MAG: toll/interleukin-1 receptor domain-containing protein [Flavobacteriaceae bacterium]|nr:toll/interleukin-1 receptor domain-containing protein [Flavobacteriaceae bacterium]
MAYVPGFEYDIFISYAHLDNKPMLHQKEGWINEFYKYLEFMLNKRCGREGRLKIWWDNRAMDGNVYFDDAIADGIKKSALMICFNSTSYESSDYCQQELSTFYEKAKTDTLGLKVGHRARIVHVLLENIPFKDWPQELEGVNAYPIHDAELEKDLGDPLETTSKKFLEQLKIIRDAVWALLDAMSTETAKEESSIITNDDKSDRFTVYLAEVSDSLRSVRKRLIAELEKQGYHAIVGTPPPDQAGAHEAAVLEALGESQLSVHLLDHIPGREIVGDSDHWYPQKQAMIALEHEVDQIIWLPEHTDLDDIDEPSYKLWMEELEEGNLANKDFDFIRGSKSTLAQKVIDHIEQLIQKEDLNQEIHAQSHDGPVSVLLDFHENDNKFVRQLTNSLTEHQIMTYYAPCEDDPMNNEEKLRDRLRESKKFVFLYGDVEPDWINERVKSTLKKLIDCDRYDAGKDDIIIYMTPPEKDSSLINLPAKIINNSAKAVLESDGFEEFLKDLKGLGS